MSAPCKEGKEPHDPVMDGWYCAQCRKHLSDEPEFGLPRPSLLSNIWTAVSIIITVLVAVFCIAFIIQVMVFLIL